MMEREVLHKYVNGNVKVTIFKNGLIIRRSEDDLFEWEFPNVVTMRLGDNEDLEFLPSLHPYTLVNIEGFCSIKLLEELKKRKVFTNLTVSQIDLFSHYEQIYEYCEKGLLKEVHVVYGGRSNGLISYLRGLLQVAQAVDVELYYGAFEANDYEYLKGLGLGLSILHGTLSSYDSVRATQEDLKKETIPLIDKLARGQDSGFASLVLDREVAWELGYEVPEEISLKENDSLYIDCINDTYSSTASSEKLEGIKDSVDDMYREVMACIK